MLIAFDLLLVVVLGLLLYSVSARDPQSPPGAFDVLQVVLVVSALLADAVALWAIAARITEFGFTPNRVAALGENVILLVNLAWSAVLYIRFLRGRGSFTRPRAVADGLPAGLRRVGGDRRDRLPAAVRVHLIPALAAFRSLLLLPAPGISPQGHAAGAGVLPQLTRGSARRETTGGGRGRRLSLGRGRLVRLDLARLRGSITANAPGGHREGGSEQRIRLTGRPGAQGRRQAGGQGRRGARARPRRRREPSRLGRRLRRAVHRPAELRAAQTQARHPRHRHGRDRRCRRQERDAAPCRRRGLRPRRRHVRRVRGRSAGAPGAQAGGRHVRAGGRRRDVRPHRPPRPA